MRQSKGGGEGGGGVLVANGSVLEQGIRLQGASRIVSPYSSSSSSQKWRLLVRSAEGAAEAAGRTNT